MRGPRPKVKNPGKLLIRILAYVMKHYKFSCIIVAVCILVSVLANVQGTMFMQTLIDDYILPMLRSADAPDFGLGVPIWFLASKDIAQYHKQLVRHGMAIIKRYLEIYGKVYNYISIDNLQAIRYIRKAGATIYPPQRWGVGGALFVPFVIER